MTGRRRDERKGKEELGLVHDIREALEAPSPLPMLQLTSALLALVDPRDRDPFDRTATPRMRPEAMIDMFAGVPLPETSALLAVIAALGTDEAMARRVGDVLSERRFEAPAWIDDLDRASAPRAVEMAHILGDGDNVAVGVRFASGEEITVVVYIDHNLGTRVKDAFVIPAPIADVVPFMQDTADVDTTVIDLPLADARTRIEQGIARTSMTLPKVETETWPACRALVEWAARLLPTGGSGYVWPEWSPEEREDILHRFMASPYARGLDPELDQDLADHLIWFGCDYGHGDPLRLSAVSVEILLVDWIPRKVVADPGTLSRVPEVLRCFIRFGHAERGIRASLTAETLDAVDEWEPGYQKLIRMPRPDDR